MIRRLPSLRRTAAALVFVLAAAAARADVLQLRDGRIVEGPKMERSGDAVVIHFAAGDVTVPMDRVADYVIEGAPPPEPATAEEKAKRAEGLVPWRGKWVKPEVRNKAHAEETARKKAALAEVQKHREWRNRYRWEGKNFSFESTLDPAIGEKWAASLEAYFEYFRKDWGIRTPEKWGKLKVCFYHDRETFERTAGVSGGVLAYYRFVAPRELNCYYDRTDPEFSQAVMFHECTHYLVDLLDETTEQPHNVNEAVAEYYAACRYDPATKSFTGGSLQEGRLVEVRTDIDSGKMMSLEDLLGGERDYRAYTWGWSFVHFLMQTPKYAPKFRKFFADLAKAKDVKREQIGNGLTEPTPVELKRVFMDRFGLKTLKDLEAEWYAYVRALQPAGVAGFEEAGTAALSNYPSRPIKAKRLLKEAIDRGSKKTSVYIQYARAIRMKPDKDDDRETTLGKALAILEKASAIDPLDADVWAQRGYVLHALDRKDEAAKLVALAREINPDEPYIENEVVDALANAAGE